MEKKLGNLFLYTRIQFNLFLLNLFFLNFILPKSIKIYSNININHVIQASELQLLHLNVLQGYYGVRFLVFQD